MEDEALRRLAALLEEHGFVDPIIARREDNLVIGGHQRLRANALREHPDKTVPVIFLDGLPDDKAKALNVSLNNPKSQGEWDLPKLAGLLVEIDTGNIDVPKLTGFAEAEIAEIVHGADEWTPPPGADGKEYDESVADDVKMTKCPECGHEFPA